MRRLIVVSAVLLVGAGALSACGGSDTNPNAPVAAPDVAANFSQPIDARGADPAWGLKIRGLQFTLQRPNQPDVVATAPGATLTAHSAAWSATLANGQTMKVNLYASPCADAARLATYPFTAEVLLPAAAPLNGCAGKPASAVAGKP